VTDRFDETSSRDNLLTASRLPQKACETNPSREKRTQLCLKFWNIVEEKSQSIHPQTSPR